MTSLRATRGAVPRGPKGEILAADVIGAAVIFFKACR
jgi:hypothetical protein